LCLSVTGCGENDAPVDADGDGVAEFADCDNTDVASAVVAEDADCNGTLTAADCDDTDPASTVVAEDAARPGAGHVKVSALAAVVPCVVCRVTTGVQAAVTRPSAWSQSGRQCSARRVKGAVWGGGVRP